MSQKTWMPLYIGDYLADTQHLSAEEHGAYILLIMHYWRNGGAIKNDKNLIKNIAKLSLKKLENVLAFFEEKDGLIFHKRIDAELQEAAENNEKNKERTRKATEARLEKQQRDEPKKDNVTSDVTFTTARASSPSPSPRKKESSCAVSAHANFENSKPENEPNDFQKIYEAGSAIFPKLATANTSAIQQWVANGCHAELDAIPEIQRKAGKTVSSWNFFTEAIASAKATRQAPLPQGNNYAKPPPDSLESTIERVRKKMLGEASNEK